MNALTILLISVIVDVVRGPSHSGGVSTQPDDVKSTYRPPPPPPPPADYDNMAADTDESRVVVTSSGCVDYEAEENGAATDRFYIRELLEDVDGDHVTVSTHYGQLRGRRIGGIPEAGA